jgi:two-component system NtrC family response regulator
MTTPKILIIDDDEGIRSQLKWGLDGYQVVTADSRASAIKQIEAHHPPLVTLDLGLPPDVEGTSEGFAILNEILAKAPKTKVIIVSGSEDAGNDERAKNNGAFGYYSKPIDIDQLQLIIQRAYVDFNKSK